MIIEDYCSYEVAKLLKEKGFNVPLWLYYDQNKEIILASWSGWEEDWNNCLFNNEPSPFISAPTHQMAMAWLREKYYISIELSALDAHFYVYTIYKLLNDKVKELYNDGVYESYEGAVEAALKYTLENLI